uniref:Cleavage and polyadenylation specificity factor subunit 2 n=1 Tax=Cucumis melo TaxID=3656 RepID=A0A9I9EMW2_CUCME
MDYSRGVSVATPLLTSEIRRSSCRDRLGRRFDVKDVAHVKFDRKTKNGTLSLFPLSKAPAAHKSVLVGDLKMVNFKQFLANKGIQVEFAGGALRCGEYVTLRKVTNASQKGGGSGTQQVVIEEPLCEDYYKIQDLLYSQFYLL